ncbi:unnamed protein product [Brassica oleracea var. botrytis]|uniref:(rape) hypothetical protein n=1 Tax=Brassica napus TaxID=3708 RepID=A0A816KH60_BRANA|nr:unnamed protein product [Brassica napus]
MESMFLDCKASTFISYLFSDLIATICLFFSTSSYRNPQP